MNQPHLKNTSKVLSLKIDRKYFKTNNLFDELEALLDQLKQ